jgi:hypothetical protein
MLLEVVRNLLQKRNTRNTFGYKCKRGLAFCKNEYYTVAHYIFSSDAQESTVDFLLNRGTEDKANASLNDAEVIRYFKEVYKPAH